MILSQVLRSGLSKMTQKLTSDIKFGPHPISPCNIFILRKHVFAMVNLKPFVPGHVLVCSRRCALTLQDLSQMQAVDLFMTAQEVARKFETIYKTECQLVCQNGPDAGQTVPHVHLHILPHVTTTSEIQSDHQEARVGRSMEDMAKEAEIYRTYFQQGPQ